MVIDKLTDLRIRAPRDGEDELLREIAFRSKSHWGYQTDVVRRWASQIDLTDPENLGREIYIAEVAGLPVGWASVTPKGEVAWLDDLWIEPAWMGKGIGARLFRHVLDGARRLGASRLEWRRSQTQPASTKRWGRSTYAKPNQTNGAAVSRSWACPFRFKTSRLRED
jgi:GNAT superfamily N-acetyltransferase